MTAPAHVLVFRPLMTRLEERGAQIEVTTRDYAQTLELLDAHGIEATSLGSHGGRSRLGKLRSLTSRLRALRGWARSREFDVALAHGSHELTLTARRLGVPSTTTFDYEFAKLQHHIGCRAATRVVVPDAIPAERLAPYRAAPPKLVQYEGLKEEYYLAEFEPDALRGCRPRRRQLTSRRCRPHAAGRVALPPAVQPSVPATARLPRQPRRRACDRGAADRGAAGRSCVHSTFPR